MPQIRAGLLEHARPPLGQWAFVDPGFARDRRSSALLVDNGEPALHTYAELEAALVRLAREAGPPLHLVIEAPLSVAFGPSGNPVGRRIERRASTHRYWYEGLGCGVIVATTYLLRALLASAPQREIRLFEGLVSFKGKGLRSSHAADVLQLRQVIRGDLAAGRLVAPDALATDPEDVLCSAFAVAGMDVGVPPVVVVASRHDEAHLH